MKETFPDTLKNFLGTVLDDLHVSLPGVVESYDAGSRTASIAPQMKKKFKAGAVLPLPVIHEVPVQFQASSEASISFPLSKGDEGLIVFSERSIDNWMSSGQAELPDDPRRFSLEDAVFIPGVQSKKNVSSGSSDGILAEFKKTKLQIKDGEVSISFGGITAIKFSESGGMEITHAAGNYKAISHVHADPQGGSTMIPTPI